MTGGLKVVSESFFNADHEFEVLKNIPSRVNPLIHFNPLIRHFMWISRFWPKYNRLSVAFFKKLKEDYITMQ